MVPVAEFSNRHEALVEEFTARVRRGENPSISEYVVLHPDLEAEIRLMLPAVLLMERCGGAAARPMDPAVQPSRTLGDFEIIREVGRGGMGVVYEARQASLQRRVAVKILPAAAGLRPELLQRFRNEAVAVARLHHTNIVQVFGVGESDGHHFIVMQFLEAQSLAHVLHTRRQAALDSTQASAGDTPAIMGETRVAPGRAASSTFVRAGRNQDWSRFVAQVGLQAGEALAYAHDQGVLHRDVKPANLLLDAHETLWVTDFGLAKIEGLDELTATGDVPGTVRYLAPERLHGRTDARSDLFSLGLVLYELLAGRPAYDAGDRPALLRQVAEGAPPPLRSLLPNAPRDLETICHKCLEWDPQKRYSTARDLADDCRRFLAGEPIHARPIGPIERLTRWSKRQPVVAGLIVAVFASLAAGTIVSAWQAVRATRARAETDQALVSSEAARNQAEEISNFLVGAFRAPNPSYEGPEIKAVDLLDRAAAELDAKLADSPEARGKLLTALGETYRGLGLPAQAVAMHQRALTLRQAALGADHPDTISSMQNLATANEACGRHELALALREEVLQLCQAKFGPKHFETLRSMRSLAGSYGYAGRKTEAISLLEETLKLEAAQLGSSHPETLTTMQQLGTLYRTVGRVKDSITLLEKTIEASRVKLDFDHPRVLNAMNNLAVAYRQAGRLDDALRMFEETLRLRRSRLGPKHPVTLATMHNVAHTLQAARRLDEAAPLYEETLALRRAKLGADDLETLNTMRMLGWTLLLAGRPAEGLPLFEESLRLHESRFGAEHPETQRSMGDLAAAYQATGKFDRAEDVLIELVALRKRSDAADGLNVCAALERLGLNCLKLQKYVDAEQALRESLTIRETQQPGQWETLNVQSMLGASLTGQNKYAEAEPLLLEANEGLAQVKDQIPADSRKCLDEARGRLFSLYDAWGHPDQADKWRTGLETSGK
jgi:serine/threonine protein kinase/tetratricopeptide (TPR) repeat protein